MITQPSPALLTATGHALLRAIAAGHSGPLQAAAGALDKLGRLLPDASPEARLTAVLLSLSTDPTPQAETTVQPPPPARARRKARDKASQSGKTSRTTRKSKAAVPRMDSNGRLLSSKEIGGVAIISQAEARKALGVSCVQMLKLEDQKLLARIQESGSRLVYYSVAEVQKLLDLIDRGADPEPTDDDAPTDGVA